MPRPWTTEEQKCFETWSAPSNLKQHWEHNICIIGLFFEAHPNLPITHETLDLAIKSSDTLPNPYCPSWSRLKFGEVKQEQSQSPAQSLIDGLAQRSEPEPVPVKSKPNLLESTEALFDGRDFVGAPASGLPDATERAKQREAAKAAHEESLKQSRKAKEIIAEAAAKKECESMGGVVGSSGYIDHHFCEMLQTVFAKNPDGSVNFRETKKLRDLCLQGYENKKSRPPLPR